MNRLVPWLLALAAVTSVASFSGAWATLQDGSKAKPEKNPAQKQAQKKRAARHAALKAVLPTLKTKLGEAIQLAEKETGGTAYSAGVEIAEGKGTYQVNLFASERFTVVNVDPETKKVTVVNKKSDEEEGEGEGEDVKDE